MTPYVVDAITRLLLILFGGLFTAGAVKMFWEISRFAISARFDINALKTSFEKFEAAFSVGIQDLQQRVGKLERNDDIRRALEAD